MDHKKNPAIALGQQPDPMVPRTVIRKVLRGAFEYHAWPMNISERKKQQVLQEEMVEHAHLLVQMEAVRYRKNRVFLNTLHRLTQSKEEDKFCQKIAWSVRDEAFQLSPTMELNRANMLETPQLAETFCCIIAVKLMAGLKPSVQFSSDTKDGDNTPYCINIPAKREATSDRLQTRLEIHVEQHRLDTLEEMRTPVVKDHDYWEKRLSDLYTENGTLPKELQELGKKFGYSCKDCRRKKKKSFKSWLSSLFKRK